MKDVIHMEPVRPELFDIYIRVGTKAYKENYTHLWTNADSSPYVQNSFTLAVLTKEHRDENTQLFLIKQQKEYIGILKLVINHALDDHSKKDALYLDKIYIAKASTGQGIGTKALQFVLLRAKAANKKLVWLATMQKGPALNFYKQNGFCIHRRTEIQFKQALNAEKSMYIMIKEIV